MNDTIPVDGEATRPGNATARISTVVQVLACVPLIAMMLHVTANAFSRKFFGHPLVDTLEISQYWYLPIIVGFGFALAVNTGEHTDAPILYQLFSAPGKLAATAISGVVTVALGAAFTWYTLTQALADMEIGRTGGTSGLVIWPATFAMPIGFGVMTVLFVIQFARKVRAMAVGEEASAEDSADLTTDVLPPA